MKYATPSFLTGQFFQVTPSSVGQKTHPEMKC